MLDWVKIFEKELEKNRVTVRLNARVSLNQLDDFDFVVVAAYAESNSILSDAGVERSYQFEVVYDEIRK